MICVQITNVVRVCSGRRTCCPGVRQLDDKTSMLPASYGRNVQVSLGSATIRPCLHLQAHTSSGCRTGTGRFVCGCYRKRTNCPDVEWPRDNSSVVAVASGQNVRIFRGSPTKSPRLQLHIDISSRLCVTRGQDVRVHSCKRTKRLGPPRITDKTSMAGVGADRKAICLNIPNTMSRAEARDSRPVLRASQDLRARYENPH